MNKSDSLVLFVDPSHAAYRWIVHTLGRMGLPIMWVQDADSALMLVETTDVALVMAASRGSDRSTRRLFNEIRRISPRTRQLMLQPPRRGLMGDNSVVSALKGAMYLPGCRFQESSLIAH